MTHKIPPLLEVERYEIESLDEHIRKLVAKELLKKLKRKRRR